MKNEEIITARENYYFKTKVRLVSVISLITILIGLVVYFYLETARMKEEFRKSKNENEYLANKMTARFDSLYEWTEQLDESCLDEEQLERRDTITKGANAIKGRLREINQRGYVIIFTGNKEIEDAQIQRQRLESIGIEQLQIFKARSSYRVVSKNFERKADAEKYLDQFRDKVRDDVLIIDIRKWCVNLEYVEAGYFDCST